MMHGHDIVAVKPANKAAHPAAEQSAAEAKGGDQGTKTGSGKLITEPFPMHVAVELYPISRLTELRIACQSALLCKGLALYLC
jgi:hypothetical protein